MVTVELSIFPVGKGEHLGKYVAKVLDVIDNSKVNYQFGPMGTTLEGSWDEVFCVVKQCFHEMKKAGPRAYGILKVDYKFKSKQTCEIKAKVASVERALGRRLKTS